MATDIYMPLMGLTMSEGTVSRWLKAEGTAVKKGEPVLEIETDKATVEIEAPSDGIIGPLLVADGTVVPVGTILSYVLAPGEAAPMVSGEGDRETRRQGDRETGRQGDKETERQGDKESDAPLASRPASSDPQRLFASPLARRVAAEHQVDLHQVEATGPNGRIVVADVQAYVEQREAEESRQKAEGGGQRTEDRGQRAEDSRQKAAEVSAQLPVSDLLTPMSSIRRLIAERMVASRQTTAHVTLALEAEATGLAAWRASLKADGVQASYNDLLVCIVAKALREHPALLGQITSDGQIKTPAQINIGLAVDTPRGLLVPVLRDVAGKGVGQVAIEAQALIERARTGKSKPEELTGGGFTISNLGMYEIEGFTPVINLPECAILGVGSIEERAVVRAGQVCARLTVAFSLAFDHRIVDGAPAARFLQRIKQLVEQPLRLLG